MARRRDLNTELSPGERQSLVELVLSYITDELVFHHFGMHPRSLIDGTNVFTMHRSLVEEIDEWLKHNGGADFVPLPKWNPGNPIPSEFNVVKGRGHYPPDHWTHPYPPPGVRPPLGNPHRGEYSPVPLEPRYEYSALCDYATLALMAEDLAPNFRLGAGYLDVEGGRTWFGGWHKAVHDAVGGSMASPSQTAACPLFWCFHAFIDDIWHEWDRRSWSWSWSNLRKPAGVEIGDAVGVLTVADRPWAEQRPHVFVKGNDQNLWVNSWDGTQWHWTNQGRPFGSIFVDFGIGVLSVKDNPSGSERPHAFVAGTDRNLWANWWDGAQWNWENHGRPPGVLHFGPVGVLTVMDSPGSAQRPHVFVRGSDGNLWVNWWDGTQWNWMNQGRPGNGGIAGPVGVITVKDTPTSPQRAHVFVQTNDGDLSVNWWDGTQWHWTNQGRPPGQTINGPAAVLTVVEAPTDAQRPHVFVRCSDGNLWMNWWNGSDWIWTNQRNPGFGIRGASMGACTVMDTMKSPQRPHVFVPGEDGDLWVNWLDGSQWRWTNQGRPTNANLGSPIGTLTVNDTRTFAERIHVFARGSDGNLWVNWWGAHA